MKQKISQKNPSTAYRRSPSLFKGGNFIFLDMWDFFLKRACFFFGNVV